MVNRIWQFRIGDGMVRTPNDFGTMGDKPESHALLDWLAAEFVSAQMERQGHRPPDRHQRRLPSIVRSRRREGEDRSAEPPPLAHEPQTLRRRNDPRRRALRRRHAQSQNRRTPRTHPHRTRSLRPHLHRIRTRWPVARQPRQERPESPRHLPPQQAQRAPAPAHRLRSARYHHLLPRAPRLHPRPAGPDAVQLRLHAGSLPVLRRAPRKILRRRPRLSDRSGLAARAWRAARARRRRASPASSSNPAARCRISALALFNRNEFLYVP